MSVEQTDVSAPVVVQRWTLFGHGRAYVKIAKQDLGYRDLKTGAPWSAVRAEFVDTVTQATNDLLDSTQRSSA